MYGRVLYRTAPVENENSDRLSGPWKQMNVLIVNYFGEVVAARLREVRAYAFTHERTDEGACVVR